MPSAFPKYSRHLAIVKYYHTPVPRVMRKVVITLHVITQRVLIVVFLILQCRPIHHYRSTVIQQFIWRADSVSNLESCTPIPTDRGYDKPCTLTNSPKSYQKSRSPAFKDRRNQESLRETVQITC